LAGRGDGQKYAFILIAIAATATSAWLAIEGSSGVKRPAAPAPSARAERAERAESEDAGAPADAGTIEEDGGLTLQPIGLFDGGLLMPSSAPRTIKLGVVLVTFAGAEGAPNHARSKKDALAIAERLAPDAKTDFHKAVNGGDPGSSDDIGRLPRGVLDPRTEVAVFGLNAGDVSDVLETPRGYWIVKRIE
jgi:hypothetical protein